MEIDCQIDEQIVMVWKKTWQARARGKKDHVNPRVLGRFGTVTISGELHRFIRDLSLNFQRAPSEVGRRCIRRY